MTDEILTTKQACALLKIHRNTLSRLVKKGMIKPIIADEKTHRFLKSDLLQMNNN